MHILGPYFSISPFLFFFFAPVSKGKVFIGRISYFFFLKIRLRPHAWHNNASATRKTWTRWQLCVCFFVYCLGYFDRLVLYKDDDKKGKRILDCCVDKSVYTRLWCIDKMKFRTCYGIYLSWGISCWKVGWV